MALISIKDVKQATRIMMQILEKLDEIYHALHDSINEDKKEVEKLEVKLLVIV